MTVCIAALFSWNYGNMEAPELGPAVVTASDRMLTSGDIQYEPPQLKMCFFNKRVLALISGEVTIHSDVIFDVRKKIGQNGDDLTVQDIANIYADSLIEVRAREAARVYLGPLGLSATDFVKGQHGLSTEQAAEITRQLQQYGAPIAEALVVGCDEDSAEIFNIDQFGAHRQSDVAFVAIGTGAPHANIHFMRSGHTLHTGFSNVLATTFIAKKTAEIAAGVGNMTDMYFITKNGWTRIDDGLLSHLYGVFRTYEAQKHALERQAEATVQAYIDRKRIEKADGTA